jgi:hypothetical protein
MFSTCISSRNYFNNYQLKLPWRPPGVGDRLLITTTFFRSQRLNLLYVLIGQEDHLLIKTNFGRSPERSPWAVLTVIHIRTYVMDYFLVAYFFVVHSLPHLHTVTQLWHFIGRNCSVTVDPSPI